MGLFDWSEEKVEKAYQEGAAAFEAEKYAAALKLLTKAAERGHAGAQFHLGLMYDEGRGVTEDKAEALRWYLKAAEQGNVYAQFNCGSCYDNGRGTEADLHKAFDWYEKAAEQGHARAQACLGGCYANGKGIWGDYGIAFYWYLKAAQQGHPGAQYSCGVLYQNGCGVEKDEEKALDWYQKAAAQGHEKAKEKVEEIQNTWNEGTLKIAASLLSEFREDGIVDGTFAAASILAKTGYAGAQYLCGMMCYRGEGTEKNIPKARYWLQKAAQSNDKKVAADARNLLRQL